MDPNNIQEELWGLSSNLPGNENPYSVPQDYFQGLASSILAKLKAESSETAANEIASLSPLLAGINRSMPYYLEHDFFRMSLDELPAITSKEDSLVLSFIDKSMPYSISSGYFDHLPSLLLNRVSPKRGKVISLQNKWMRLAMVSAVAIILAVSGIFYFTGNRKDNKDPIAQVKSMSTQELNDFINSTDINLTNAVTAQNDTRINDVKNMLKDVPDNELESFLKQLPADDASVTN